MRYKTDLAPLEAMMRGNLFNCVYTCCVLLLLFIKFWLLLMVHGVEQNCIVKLSMMMQMFYIFTVQDGSHQTHMTSESLKYS